MSNFTPRVCKVFYTVNIDVPAGVGAPPLDTQLRGCQVVGIASDCTVSYKSLPPCMWHQTSMLYCSTAHAPTAMHKA